MSNETALGNALKSAMQSMSKTKQTKMIADHIYGKYDVFKRFKPLALGIEQELQQALPQFDPALIVRALSNHCRRPKYLLAVAKGGKRFNLANRPQGEITPEEQQHALTHPGIRESLEKQQEKREQRRQQQRHQPEMVVGRESQRRGRGQRGEQQKIQPRLLPVAFECGKSVGHGAYSSFRLPVFSGSRCGMGESARSL